MLMLVADHGRVTGKDETQALRDVQARLAEQFPQVDDEVVEAAVRLAVTELDGPIRDFVPVLAERTARSRLSTLTRDQPRPSRTAGARSAG